MIRRPAGRDFLLITQADHAKLAGRLAEQIGNDTFAPPQPRAEVMLAVANHDAGWPIHDDLPTLNAAGLPLHLFETPMALATRIWGESARRAVELDAYAGLLVSLHQLTLSGASSHERARPGDLFLLNKFQHAQVELQEKLRRRLGLRTDIPLHFGLAKRGATPEDDRLRCNYRWLAAADRLSLQLCCGKPLFSQIEQVYPRAGVEPFTLELRGDGSDALAPWPFGPDEVRCEVAGNRVRGEPFADETAFRQAYADAPTETVHLTLRRLAEK